MVGARAHPSPRAPVQVRIPHSHPRARPRGPRGLDSAAGPARLTVRSLLSHRTAAGCASSQNAACTTPAPCPQSLEGHSERRKRASCRGSRHSLSLLQLSPGNRNSATDPKLPHLPEKLKAERRQGEWQRAVTSGLLPPLFCLAPWPEAHYARRHFP